MAPIMMLSARDVKASGDGGSFVAPNDQALVVWVRPRGLPSHSPIFVVDERKMFRAAFSGKRHAVHRTTPGKHTYYVISNIERDAQIVRADLAPGRTYIVRVDAVLRGAEVWPVRRDSQEFAESTEWLRSTKLSRTKVEEGGEGAMLVSTTAWILNQLKAAEKNWKKLDQQTRDDRTLRPNDGRSAEEARLLMSR